MDWPTRVIALPNRDNDPLEVVMNQAAAFEDKNLTRAGHHRWLIASGATTPLADLLARMLASQLVGEGAMPRWLGLTPSQFEALLARHLPAVGAHHFSGCGEPLDPQRSDEHAELRQLFLAHALDDEETALPLADILMAGCMGSDHLWQDMGFWSRRDLSAYISHAFAPLAQKNVHDMKWKKFFYKQLCIQEGVYTCRAPSCQVCADYSACFGPEE